MSVTTTPTTRSRYAEPLPGASPTRPSGGATWAKLAVVAAILAASGGARLWQERRVERVLELGRSSPFPLADLPMKIGSWEGREATMDPRIVRITGSTDLVSRHYIDRRTGVGLDVIVVYGPTSDMLFHTPELCYPSAGFAAMPGVFERSIAVEGTASATVPFRSLAFTKGEGGLADSQEVYYSLRYDGRWTTQSASHKASKRIPGMYKVQVSRRISDRESREVDNPCEPFLAALIGEIETRIARTRTEKSTTD
jgi:EpsI family protein